MSERVRTRAFFYWENKTGINWSDPLSNWEQAAKDEEILAGLPGRKRWPYLVVDQNSLRDPAVIVAGAGPFLLPDVAIAELCKGTAWQYVAERSLALLAANAGEVHLAHSVGPIMQEELTTGVLMTDPCDPIATSGFQRILRDFVKNSTTALAAIAPGVGAAKPLAESQHFDGPRNKQTVIDVHDSWKRELSQEQLKILRREKHRAPLFAELLSDASMTGTLRDMLLNAGYPRNIAQNLVAFPSFTSAHSLALVALALLWLAENGLANAPEDRLTNDLADLDYVVLSIFCRGYATKEGRMRLMRDILWNALSALWTRHDEQYLAAVR